MRTTLAALLLLATYPSLGQTQVNEITRAMAQTLRLNCTVMIVALREPDTLRPGLAYQLNAYIKGIAYRRPSDGTPMSRKFEEACLAFPEQNIGRAFDRVFDGN